MRNAPRLPLLSLYLAAGITILLLITTRHGGRFPLTEVELGLVAGALTLAVYGLQGLISIAVEGIELTPGRRAPMLTGPLSAAIVLCSIALFAVAIALSWGIA